MDNVFSVSRMTLDPVTYQSRSLYYATIVLYLDGLPNSVEKMDGRHFHGQKLLRDRL